MPSTQQPFKANVQSKATMANNALNDMVALTDSQLAASLDAIFSDPTDFSTVEMNAEERRVDSTAVPRTETQSTQPQASSPGEALVFPPARAGAGSLQQAFQQEMTLMGGTGSSCASSLSGTDESPAPRVTAASATTKMLPVPTDAQRFSGPMQIFGREVPFAVPPPRPAGNVTSLPPSSDLKRNLDASAVSENEYEHERRRQDRNTREQQRSHQISDQISVLRELLEESKVECKADKFSTLATVVDHVQELQRMTTMLDSEHKKLLETIQQTTDIMSSQYRSAQGGDQTDGDSTQNAIDAVGESAAEHEVFVQGLDYKSVFQSSPFALATTSIDGRFLDCSKGFENLTQFSRAELLPLEKEETATESLADTSSTSEDSMFSGNSEGEAPTKKNLSLFNVLFHGDMSSIYHGMYEILQTPGNHLPEASGSDVRSDCLSKCVRLGRKEEAQVSVGFVRKVHARDSVTNIFYCIFFRNRRSCT